MNPQQFFLRFAGVARVVSSLLTAALLLSCILFLLVGDLAFGIVRWGAHGNQVFYALMLEAVPNVGIVAIGLAVVYKTKTRSWSEVAENMSAGVIFFIVIGVFFGIFDAIKDAQGVLIKFPLANDPFMRTMAFGFGFILSAAGELIALSLPDLLQSTMDGLIPTQTSAPNDEPDVLIEEMLEGMDAELPVAVAAAPSNGISRLVDRIRDPRRATA